MAVVSMWRAVPVTKSGQSIPRRIASWPPSTLPIPTPQTCPLAPDGSHIYTVGWTLGPFVASLLADVIDTRTNAQTATVLLGNQDEPVRMAVTPDGGRAHVTGDAGHVGVVDTTLNARMSTITVSSGNALNGVAITPGGTRAYVTSGKINTIFVMDTAAGDVIGSVASNDPAGLAISGAN